MTSGCTKIDSGRKKEIFAQYCCTTSTSTGAVMEKNRVRESYGAPKYC